MNRNLQTKFYKLKIHNTEAKIPTSVSSRNNAIFRRCLAELSTTLTDRAIQKMSINEMRDITGDTSVDDFKSKSKKQNSGIDRRARILGSIIKRYKCGPNYSAPKKTHKTKFGMLSSDNLVDIFEFLPPTLKNSSTFLSLCKSTRGLRKGLRMGSILEKIRITGGNSEYGSKFLSELDYIPYTLRLRVTWDNMFNIRKIIPKTNKIEILIDRQSNARSIEEMLHVDSLTSGKKLDIKFTSFLAIKKFVKVFKKMDLGNLSRFFDKVTFSLQEKDLAKLDSWFRNTMHHENPEEDPDQIGFGFFKTYGFHLEVRLLTTVVSPVPHFDSINLGFVTSKKVKVTTYIQKSSCYTAIDTEPVKIILNESTKCLSLEGEMVVPNSTEHLSQLRIDPPFSEFIDYVQNGKRRVYKQNPIEIKNRVSLANEVTFNRSHMVFVSKHRGHYFLNSINHNFIAVLAQFEFFLPIRETCMGSSNYCTSMTILGRESFGPALSDLHKQNTLDLGPTYSRLSMIRFKCLDIYQALSAICTIGTLRWRRPVFIIFESLIPAKNKIDMSDIGNLMKTFSNTHVKVAASTKDTWDPLFGSLFKLLNPSQIAFRKPNPSKNFFLKN